jgi:hypothetical protein
MSNGPLQERNYKISLNDAATMTAAFRSSYPDAKKGGAFNKKAIEDVIDQTGCTGLRYYFGEDGDENLCLIVVGIDSNGDDMTDGEIRERAWPCPPVCGSANSLNGEA